MKSIKSILFLLILFVSISSCEKDSLEIQQTISKKNISQANDHEKIKSLKKGLRKKIKKYNKKFKSKNKFLKKYGKLDGKNAVTVKFPDFDENFIVAIPFKKKKLKGKKLLISYYKEGVRTYKIIKNKNYDPSKYSNAELGFIENLNSIFYLTSSNNTKSSVTKFGNCTPRILAHDYANCTIAYQDPCNFNIWIISTLGKGETCGGELDEVELDLPDNDSDNPYDDYDDPYDDPEDWNPPIGDDDPEENDCLEFDCEDGLGADNDELTEEEKVPPSCKSFDFQILGNFQYSYVKGIRFLIINKNGTKYYVKYSEPMEFGAPNKDRFGNTFNPGAAAEASAEALQDAISNTRDYIRSAPWTNIEDVKRYFEDELKREYPQHIPGGRVKIRPTSLLVPKITNYRTAGINIGGIDFGLDNCN